ncbi:MAG: hypothetical protein LBM77_09940 [Spirochaetaceae bacterium]|nr:hypothetical protein [Spirochaetaceae bacterium]
MKTKTQKRMMVMFGLILVAVLSLGAYSCASSDAAQDTPAAEAGADANAATPSTGATSSSSTAPAATGAQAGTQPATTPATTPIATVAPAAAAPVPTTTAEPVTEARPAVVSEPIASTAPNITPTQQYVLDWSNRSFGLPFNPEWLQRIVQGDGTLVKANYHLPEGTMIRYAVASSPYKNNAMTMADSNYAVQLSNELKRVVLSQTGGILTGAEFRALNSAVSGAKVTLVGHRRLVDFWQLIETRNTMTGERNREYIYYVIFAVNEMNWDEMINMYVKQILGYLPADKIKASDLASQIKDQTTQDSVKNQRQLLDQLEAQLNALESELSTDKQQQAYKSGDPNAEAAASVSPEDSEWINALIQSSNVLFQ